VRSVHAIEGLIHASAGTPPFEAHLSSDSLPQHGGHRRDELIDQAHLITGVRARFATCNAASRTRVGELGGHDDAPAKADHRAADEPPNLERPSDGAHLAPPVAVGEHRLQGAHLETRRIA